MIVSENKQRQTSWEASRLFTTKCQMIWKATWCPESIVSVCFCYSFSLLSRIEMMIYLVTPTSSCIFSDEICYWFCESCLERKPCQHFVKHFLLICTFQNIFVQFLEMLSCTLLQFQDDIKYLSLMLVTNNPQAHRAFKINPISFIFLHIRANKGHRMSYLLWDYTLWCKMCWCNQLKFKLTTAWKGDFPTFCVLQLDGLVLSWVTAQFCSGKWSQKGKHWVKGNNRK